MPALNRVQLMGRLGKGPESRFTPKGKQVSHFSLAVSNRWKSALVRPRNPPNGLTSRPGDGWAKSASSTCTREAWSIWKSA